MDSTMEPGQTQPYFGGCPECGHHDGYINIGRSHWFFCAEDRVKWLGGTNVFSSWQHETEDEQRAAYEELDFGSYRDASGHPTTAEVR